ncbi:MAG: TolC family protein [Candidatus Zixiibacteriota bacterium]
MTRTVLSCIWVLLLLSSLSFGQTDTISSKAFSLDQCIEMALKTNAGLIAAENSYRVARSDVWTGWGRVIPGLNSQLGYSRQVSGPGEFTVTDSITGQVLATGLTSITTSHRYSAGISASQNWSLGGYDFYNIREKNAATGSALNSYHLSRQDLILSVKQAYFEVLRATMLLDIQKDALKRADEQLKIAETKYQLGSASYSDVLKAKVLHGDVELALITADNTLKVDKATLNSWVGRSVDLPIEVEENLSQPQFDYSYEDALAQALKENFNLKKAGFDQRSAEDQLGMARSSFFPNFNLSGSYSWGNVDLSEIKWIRQRDYTWNLGASFSFPIFEGFQRKQNLSSAKANLKYAKENLRQTKNDVTLQLKQAFLGVQQAKQSIDLTKSKTESAKEDLDLTQEKYSLGAASILDLLDVEVSFKQAQSDQVQALYDYNLAVAQADKAMGK